MLRAGQETFASALAPDPRPREEVEVPERWYRLAVEAEFRNLLVPGVVPSPPPLPLSSRSELMPAGDLVPIPPASQAGAVGTIFGLTADVNDLDAARLAIMRLRQAPSSVRI